MKPQIVALEEKKLIGMSLKMSLENNKTGVLWKDFSPRIKEISNGISSDKFSLQQYDAEYFSAFNPNKEFVKWAAIEVENYDSIPSNMETLILKAGLYAVFHYKGYSHDSSFFHSIYTEWLPKSGYVLDQLPHFEVLGTKYKNNDPNSEEEIWIPIKKA
ncbi:GyrI-like domain-containing protein [Wenyingzhuangia sp. IMCC45574]